MTAVDVHAVVTGPVDAPVKVQRRNAASSERERTPSLA